jgi:[glutamine synthetase] adenylyltransferase / [glutamine synthetase]-adenylyl-L-tyrosine phosphorylase
VAVSLQALTDYYAGEAETWEFLALTRARVIWSTSPDFAADVSVAIEAALRQSRDPGATALEVRDMRALMAKERPPQGFWDLKLSPGGLVDVEFAAQYLQIIHAAAGGPLRVHTGEALASLAEAGLAEPADLEALEAAWTVQQDLSQVLKVALEDRADPHDEPKAFRQKLAKAGGARDFATLERRLKAGRIKARAAFEATIPARGSTSKG